MYNSHRRRRLAFVALFFVVLSAVSVSLKQEPMILGSENRAASKSNNIGTAVDGLNELTVKARESYYGYTRDEFGSGWAESGGCDTRNIILNRDLSNTVVDAGCRVLGGVLSDPYTGKTVRFVRGPDSSGDIQIDHVVALSDAWQKGAQELAYEARVELANDPLELLAVDGAANQQKSGSDAASWLPSNVVFGCQYVARQIAVKLKYHLWVDDAEHSAISKVLGRCQNQLLPTEQ
jgi:hypothetical protein